MASQFLVRNLAIDERVDDGLFVHCIGFETRSGFIARERRDQSTQTLAIAYTEGRTLSFGENLEFAKRMGFEIIGDERRVIEEALKHRIIPAARRRRGAVQVVIDVSSMDRAVMSSVLIAVLDSMVAGDKMRLLYAPSAFQEPNLELLPIKHVETAHPRISGEVDSPGKGRALLLGVGFEYGVSLNVLDHQEPDVSFIFRPQGFDNRFSISVQRANFGFDFGEQRDYEIIDYHLGKMAFVYDAISSVVVSMKHSMSIVAVPLGPKILSAVMILVGYVHQPSVSVVRYSLSTWDYYHDVVAAGMVVGLEVLKVNRGQRLVG
jgi:hypothetical protein